MHCAKTSCERKRDCWLLYCRATEFCPATLVLVNWTYKKFVQCEMLKEEDRTQSYPAQKIQDEKLTEIQK
jgi:hypothetical protein